MTEFLAATVWKEIYRNKNNFYTVVKALVNDEMETLVGYFPIVNEGLVINFHGKKELGKMKTMQYKVESYSIELPTSPYNLTRFLKNDFFGLAENVAKIIEKKIGLEYLEHHSDKNFLVSKIGEDFYNEYSKKFIETSNRLNEIMKKLELMEKMIKMGFANDLSSKVAFSEFIPIDIEGNPYQLITPFELKWDVVDSIATKYIQKDSMTRIQEAICYVLDEQAQSYAHVFLPRLELHNMIKKLLRLNISENIFTQALSELNIANKIVIDVGDRVYGYKYYQAEAQLSNDLYRLHYTDKEDELLVKEMMEYVKQDTFSYSEEQTLSIERALLYPLSIINGPAGTGKTTALVKIIECLEKMKKVNKKGDKEYFIKLCAPTGKASERMKQVTDKEAQTIHSILSHHPVFKTPSFDEKTPLIYDCYIFDEFGMADVVLASEIMNAVKVGAKVIIVGDVAQLPSIGPGNVLKELINDSEFVRTELTRVYRQGKESRILDLANSIKDGNTNIQEILYEKSSDLAFIKTNNINEISSNILHICKVLLNKPNFNFIENVQIITPIHKSDIGTIFLNKAIQKMLNEGKERKKVTMGDKVFYEGDKVMHLINNKDKNIYNGETGKIISITSKTIKAEFSGGKIVSYEGEEIYELELAFACSIHKMQGSESPIIIMPIHTTFYRMLLRTLLYTGVTRAKTKLMLLGEEEALIKCINDVYAVKRNSSLKERFVESRMVKLF